MKQIRSGQSFLYRNAGYDSTVLEIRMKDKVTGSYLQAALTETAKRFPYLTEKLVEKDAKYYLHKNDVSMVAVKTNKYRSLGSMATGYHLLDVTYIGNGIRVAFHHGLCDGRGVKPFVETLLYEYCSKKYRKPYSCEGIRVPREPIDEGESCEPFGTEPFVIEKAEFPKIIKDGYALPEGTRTPDSCYRTEYLLDEKAFVSAAKAIGATPSIFAVILFSESVMKLNPRSEKPIICNLAMDLRGAIGMENTHRNCVGSAYLPYFNSDRDTEKTELAQRYRTLLAEQRNPNFIKSGINMQIGLWNKLDSLKTLAEKRQMLSFFNGMINNTYVLSYMGQLRLNDYADCVEFAHFFSDGICGLTINMLAASGKLSFEVLQGFQGTRYATAFREALTPFGLLSVSETEAFTTGTDKTYLTASYMAERYYVKPE